MGWVEGLEWSGVERVWAVRERTNVFRRFVASFVVQGPSRSTMYSTWFCGRFESMRHTRITLMEQMEQNIEGRRGKKGTRGNGTIQGKEPRESAVQPGEINHQAQSCSSRIPSVPPPRRSIRPLRTSTKDTRSPLQAGSGASPPQRTRDCHAHATGADPPTQELRTPGPGGSPGSKGDCQTSLGRIEREEWLVAAAGMKRQGGGGRVCVGGV